MKKLPDDPAPMQRRRRKWNSILWIEASGFLLIIALSWLAEITRFPRYLFGEPYAANWPRAIFRTVLIGSIWIWVHFLTRRLLRRLHYLEDFLRVCAWCRRLAHEDKWLTMEEYFSSNFSTRTTHRVCPDCLNRATKELDDAEKSVAAKPRAGSTD